MDEADLPGRRRVAEAGAEGQILRPRRAEEVEEQVEGGHREAVAEGAGDGDPEASAGRGDADVAGGGDREATTGAGAPHRRYGRDPDLHQGADPALHPLLVGDRVLLGPELLELADVGAGDEGLIARAGQDQAAERVVGIRLPCDLAQPVVHREGHRVPGLGPVEGQPEDVTPAILDQVRYLSSDRCTLPIAFRGSSDRNRTERGHLNLASRS